MTKFIKYYFGAILFMFVTTLCFSANVFSQVEENSIESLIKKVNAVDSSTFELCVAIKNVFFEIEKEGLSDNIESESIYRLIDLIYNKALYDDRSIFLLIELDNIIKKNAELGQYLSELQYKLVLYKTKSFVHVYELLSDETKNIVNGNLSWIIEYDYQQLFIDKLDSLDCKKTNNIRIEKVSLSNINAYMIGVVNTF